MMELHYRHAVPEDTLAIVGLVESAYRGDISRIGWTTEADFLEGQRIDSAGVLDNMSKAGSQILLAEHSGQLMACCHLEKFGDACYFGMFSVRPDQQGSGIGKRLMHEAENFAREAWGCQRMEMTVIDIRQELIEFYQRRGYRRTGIFKPFPYGDERYGIPQRDDLRFEILEKTLSADQQ
jgi:GNAT superfamily N-acetyltransferase